MKRLLLGCLVLLFAGPASSQIMLRGVGLGAATGGCTTTCMVTPILALAGASGSFPSNSATNYVGFIGGPAAAAPSATLTSRQTPFPVSGTMSNLKVVFPTTISQGTYAISLNVAGSSTALTCTVQSGTQNCSDSADSVTVSPGQLVAWQITPAGTPTTQAAQIQLSATFTSLVGQESPLIGGMVVNNMSATAINYASFGASQNAANATENVVSVVLPTAGTIDQLYMQLNVSAGSGATYTATVEHQGSDTSLTCVTATNGSSCSDLNTGHAVSVSAGETISIKSCPSNTATCPAGSAPTAREMLVGVRWIPTTSNEALLFDTFTTVPTTNSTRFGPLNGSSSGGDTTEVDLNVAPVVLGGMTIKKLNVLLAPVPGGSSTRTLNLRAGTGSGQATVGTPGNVSCTVTAAATTCSDSTNSYSAATGTFLNWQTTISGTNAALTQFKVSEVVTVP